MKIHVTKLLLLATIYVDLYVFGFLCVKKRLTVCVCSFVASESIYEGIELFGFSSLKKK